MLVINVDALFKARGIPRKTTYLMKFGLSYRVARRLAIGDTRILKLDHIEKLCIALRCTPNDLLYWTPTGHIADNHPLRQLHRKHQLHVIDEIHKLSLDQLARLGKKIEELKDD